MIEKLCTPTQNKPQPERMIDMFEIEVTLCNKDDKQSEIIIELSGDDLTSLKNEMTNAILNSIHNTGCYDVEIIISKDCDYYDTDEFCVFVDVEDQVVTLFDNESMNMQIPLNITTSIYSSDILVVSKNSEQRYTDEYIGENFVDSIVNEPVQVYNCSMQ